MERFKTLRPKPAQYDTVQMVEVEENSEVKMRTDSPYKVRAQRWSGLKQNKYKRISNIH